MKIALIGIMFWMIAAISGVVLIITTVIASLQAKMFVWDDGNWTWLWSTAAVAVLGLIIFITGGMRDMKDF